MPSTLTPAAATESLAGKYLTFQLDGEFYGIPLLRVQEIIGLMRISAVPRAPACVRGLLNLRGRIIPVIDMRVRFGMEAAEDTAKTCIIVVSQGSGAEAECIGLLVDSVAEVAQFPADQIEPTPDLGCATVRDSLLAMGKLRERVVALLNVPTIIDLNGWESDCAPRA